ncbi:hypothetical protein IVB16_40560 (plasmid) [Bradyrhizobium sp. 183]|uniref:hypothetical protein n=1 Tax=unclassified Bradyrhizobium TaxID=2631580 RepID=UPI001FFAD29F|nr:MULTISPECIES: hypothetical protein [unclassified Bradyrhizobium]MCK1568611.1 hypothetical protein [Bradyrhizobium sp. 173]UPJ84936.1 hypothetical protein IVB17_40265 [Bradyrhizobium sp. 184]UPJ92732.1 hypothetical protein IVB16_40560 [Bradyrhizobium sp. 183]
MQGGDRFNANIAAPISLGCTNAHHIAAWIALQKPYIVYGNGAPIAMLALCALVLFVSNWGTNAAITALARLLSLTGAHSKLRFFQSILPNRPIF